MGAAVLQGLVWLGEPEPAQAGGRSGLDAQAPFGQPADLSETSHHQRQARSAREREATTTLSRANDLNGAPAGIILFSAENRCVATSCDYRGVPGFRTLKIQCENKVTRPRYIVANRYQLGA